MHVLAWIVLAAWLLTLLNTILNLLLVRRLRSEGPADGPLISIVIPARNEELTIEQTVRAMLAQSYRNLELIVVNDRSTDTTGQILDAIASEGRLKVIHGEEPPAGWLGKPWALHEGSLAARGEALLFVDADIIYSPSAVAAATDAFRSSGASMATFFPRFEMRGFWENVAMPQLTMTGLSFIPVWLSNRTVLRRLGIGGGTGNMIARRDYEAIGGHEALRNAVIDDVGLARLVRGTGRRSVVFRADDLISVRMYRGAREIVEGFTKNIFHVFGSYFGSILFVVLGIVFHVWPYFAALNGDRLSITTVIVITITRIVLFTSAGYPPIYALFAHPLMVLFWTWISLRSMWFTGVRKRVAWRGRTYDARDTRFGSER